MCIGKINKITFGGAKKLNFSSTPVDALRKVLSGLKWGCGCMFGCMVHGIFVLYILSRVDANIGNFY